MPPALAKLTIIIYSSCFFFCFFFRNYRKFSHLQWSIPPLQMPEQLMLEVKCSWAYAEVCVRGKEKKERKKSAQKWSMSLSTSVSFAGVCDELLLWLGGKTSLSDVALQSPDRQGRRAAAAAAAAAVVDRPQTSNVARRRHIAQGIRQSVVIHHP